MEQQPKGAWLVMSALVAIMILVAGPALVTLSVFLTPLLRTFHWSHAQVSLLAFASAATGGVVAPLVGWLIDKIGARWVIGTGLVIMGAGYWLASWSNSINPMVASFAFWGLGGMLVNLLPVMVVAVNWFGGRRGFAGGVVFISLGIGMTIWPLILTWLIGHEGWRWAMRWESLPVLLIVLPWVLAVVRTRPAIAEARTTAEEVAALPGVEFWPAMATMAFWLVLAADLLWNTAFQSVIVHSITYMIYLGFSPQHAAIIFSAQTLMSGLGAIPLGILADRIGVRKVLCFSLVSVAIGILGLCGFSVPHLRPYLIPVYILFWGTTAGAVFPLLPILLAEVLGLRRFGSLSGIVRCTSAFAMALGPMWSGWVYDRTGSYVPAFEVASAVMVVAVLAVVLVRPAKGRDEVPIAAAVGVAG